MLSYNKKSLLAKANRDFYRMKKSITPRALALALSYNQNPCQPNTNREFLLTCLFYLGLIACHDFHELVNVAYFVLTYLCWHYLD